MGAWFKRPSAILCPILAWGLLWLVSNPLDDLHRVVNFVCDIWQYEILIKIASLVVLNPRLHKDKLPHGHLIRPEPKQLKHRSIIALLQRHINILISWVVQAYLPLLNKAHNRRRCVPLGARAQYPSVACCQIARNHIFFDWTDGAWPRAKPKLSPLSIHIAKHEPQAHYVGRILHHCLYFLDHGVLGVIVR